jgi:hypothetical protein
MQAVTALRGTAGLAALATLGAVVAGTSVRLERLARPADAAARLVYLPDARLLRPLVLGWDGVLADVLWFRTISYFGARYETERTYPWLARMCDLVTDLDPRAEHVYRFAGLILPWEAHEVDEGLRLLEKGVRNLPESWMLRYYLGMTRYFFESDLAAAAEHLGVAARLPGAPPVVARLAAVMHARRSDPATTIQFLRELLANTDSAQMREVLTRSIEDAQFRARAGTLEAAAQGYRARFGTPPPSIDALVERGLLRALPADPYGGVWRLDAATGRVGSSTGRTPRELHESASQQARRRPPATPTGR